MYSERLPRSQVFCVLLGDHQSGATRRGDTGEAQEKKFIIHTGPRETVSVH